MATSNAQKIEKLNKLYEYASDEESLQITSAIQALQAKDVANPFLVGVGSGMNRVGQDVYGLGVGAGEMMGIGDEGSFDEYRQGVNQERDLMNPLKEESGWATGGEILGEMVAALPAGGVTGATAKQIPHWGARLATNVGIGGVQGALGSTDPIEGALWGAGGSGAGEIVGDVIGRLSSKSAPTIPPTMTGVPTMRADDTGSIYGAMERAAEMSPSGRGDVVAAREGQQEALQEGVGKLKDQYNTDANINDIPTSMNETMKAAKEKAGALYDEVGETMTGKTVGDDWSADIKTSIERLRSLPPSLQDSGLITRLESYLDMGEMPSWEDMRKLRGIIGGDISDTFKGGGQVGTSNTPELYGAKKAVTRALDESADDFAGSQWRNADEYYQENVARPYKDSPSIVSDIMNKQTPEEMVDKILSKGVADNPTRVGHVMNAMDETGKAALRSEMLNRAFQETSEGVISPANTANFIHSKRAVFEEMFPNENIDDLVTFLRHIKRAGSAGDIPNTGMGAAISSGLLPTSLVGSGALASGADLVTTGGLATGAMLMTVLHGKLMAAAATGKSGALGDVIASFKGATEPTGRLAGSAVETDD